MTDKTKLYDIFHEFLDITSINGFKNIVVSKRKEVKIAWVLIILMSCCICIYMVVGNCLNYVNFETKTTIREINEPLSTFPTIVLCNRNLFTNEYSYEYLKNFSKTQNLTTSFEKYSRKELKDFDFLYKAFANYLNNISKLEEVQLLDYNMSEILLSCEFNGEECDESNFEWYYHNLYGNCYIYNKDSSLISYNPGKTRGLTLELFVGLYDGLDKFSTSKGLAVIITNSSSSNASNEDGVFVSMGIVLLLFNLEL
jgi:hypothetical protein